MFLLFQILCYNLLFSIFFSTVFIFLSLEMGESEGAGQKYCLRWNNHSDSIISEFDILFNQEDFVDVTLSCDRQSVKAHKVYRKKNC